MERVVQMSEEDIKVMREWIATYFDKIVQPKIDNLNKMVTHGFVEEALVLALCYIDAIANFDRPKRNDRKITFINTVYDYSNFKDLFSRISKIFLIRMGRDISEAKTKSGVSISHFQEVKSALLRKYGRENDHLKEVDKDGVIQYLKTELRTCDWQNLESNLDRFSYAAVLYERWRSAGVHEMGLETSIHNGQPVIERNGHGDDIYYTNDILCFSKEIVLSTLTNLHRNLKSECLCKIKWPCEVIR